MQSQIPNGPSPLEPKKVKRMLDLCSGLGGASEAFVEAGWEVVRIESNPALEHIPHTRIADVMDYRPDVGLSIGGTLVGAADLDLVWASPPCLDFSQGFNAPGPTAMREGRDFVPDVSLLLKVKEIIDVLKPKYWVIENVAGASRIFTELLGRPPRQIIGPYLLWGIFPFIAMDYSWVRPLKTQSWKGKIGDPLRAAKRAKVPMAISRKLCEAITHQRTLGEY